MPASAPRILYVDDEESNRVVFKHSFSPQFTVVTCASGEEALEHVSRSPPAVIVTDQRMPGMTGIELLERVREINPSIQRLLLTAFNDAETKLHNGTGNCGCIQHHFLKPFVREEIERAIATPEEMLDRLEKMTQTALSHLETVLAADEQRHQEIEALIEVSSESHPQAESRQIVATQ